MGQLTMHSVKNSPLFRGENDEDAVGCAMVVVLVTVASADEKVEKIDARMLVGRWKGAMEGQGSMEFTKDGKYKMTNGKGEVTDEGTYEVKENKVTIGNGFRHDVTVWKMTETELFVTGNHR